MASPQKENGFTSLSNELYEAILRANITLREIKILLTIIRYTYGFNRKEHDLSVRFISNATRIQFQHISSSIKSLLDKNVITISQSETHSQSRVIKLNKDYDTWSFNRNQKSDGLLNESSQISDGRVPKSVTETVTESGTKKYIKHKLNTFTVSDFEKFWNAFPNGELGEKGSKKKAQQEFLKLNPNMVSLDTLISAITNQANHKRSLIAKKEFAPKFQHVERWLKNERWNDEIPQDQIIENKTYQPTTDFMKELLHAAN